MTTNFGTTIDRESWEAYIVDPYSPMVSISREGRSSPNRKNNLTERGFVVRDKIINKRIFPPAVGALEIIKDMREVETWKTNGMVIGAPALTSAPRDGKVVDEGILQTPFVHQCSEYVLSDPLRLTPEQLTDLFKKIAEFGRKKRLGRSE